MEATLNSALGRTTLGPGTLTMGRAPDNKIVVNDPQASSHHAEITAGSGETSYILTDLNSTNGTFVNEQRLTPQTPRTLNANDVIRIGGIRFIYEVAGSGYDPTVRADPPEYGATVYAAPPGQPLPDAGGYGSNYGGQQIPPVPSLPYGTPPQPAYPQAGYPQAGYPQPGYPQAGYPQQPAYPQPGVPPVPGTFGAPAQPKKSRVGIWIAIAVIVVVVVCGVGGAVVLLANQSTPTKTLQAFCTALKTDDAQGSYDQFSSRVKAKLTLAQWQQQIQQIKSVGGISDCTISNVQESGSMASGDVVLTARATGQTTKPTLLNLINESGTWKIDVAPNNQSAP